MGMDGRYMHLTIAIGVLLCVVVYTIIYGNVKLMIQHHPHQEKPQIKQTNNQEINRKNTPPTTPVTNQITKMQLTWFYRPHWYPKTFSFMNCSFSNCLYSINISEMNQSEAIMFYYEYLGNTIPYKPKGQKWILFNFESPVNEKPLLNIWNDQFDLYHTYLTGSDILRRNSVELRKKQLNKNYNNIFDEKKGFAAWVVSKCNTTSKRFIYVKKLQKLIDIDIYGKCGHNKTFCRHGTNQQCHSMLSKFYKFHLAFENSICTDYVTEKLTNGYSDDHDAIVVYRGAPNVDNLFPMNSFINADHYASVKQLAKTLLRIGSNESEYTHYLKTKHKYHIDQPHPFCKMCKVLNTLNSMSTEIHKRDFNTWYRKDKCIEIRDII